MVETGSDFIELMNTTAKHYRKSMSVKAANLNLTLEGPCIIFAIYIQSNEIHNVVALIKVLLVLRYQLYVFRTVTVHPQELLCRYCMCRLWYVVRKALSLTSSWYNRYTSWTYRIVCLLPRTTVCTYSIYKEAPEDGPLRSETCRADT